jgi:hypothetical protein
VDEPEEQASGHHVFFADNPLLDARAAALDQDNQHDDKQHAGNNPDKCCTIHAHSPFPNFRSKLMQGQHTRRGFEGIWVLLDARAAALDQDNQHDDKQHAGNDPDKCRTIHCNSPFLNFRT